MSGAYLYDEDPEALHTGTPRRRRGLLLGVFGGTVVVGVAAVVALPLVKGSGEEQAREVVGVFLAALEAGDTETAGGLLCQSERERGAAEETAAGYAQPGTARIEEVTAGEVDGTAAQQVLVRWDDGGTSTETTVSVVLEDGPRVCGSTPAG
ncbi:hypothetical protein JOD57_004022 [Geodermatophilus bullaregiensis]|uniref:Rv0361 family membrane protein n=1 Tax=Geodermatophilus bullaregiensis TaxID=1564160 RepID=UPI00195776B7|nr:hypothetical protein [Geodermatophilus bullaregiensis]MBM7808185.1 hypothetical protein [Geodermatophilus bullaregiensis]